MIITPNFVNTSSTIAAILAATFGQRFGLTSGRTTAARAYINIFASSKASIYAEAFRQCLRHSVCATAMVAARRAEANMGHALSPGRMSRRSTDFDNNARALRRYLIVRPA